MHKKVILRKCGDRRYRVLIDGVWWGEVRGYELASGKDVVWTAKWFNRPGSTAGGADWTGNLVRRYDAIGLVLRYTKDARNDRTRRPA